MRRAADRRGQSTVEWLALLGAIGTALAVGAVVVGDLPDRVAARLAPEPAARPDNAVLAAALRAAPGALSVLGARTWLADELGPAAADAHVARAVAAELAASHPRWGEDLRLVGPALRGRRRVATIRTIGPLRVRLVGAAAEQSAGAGARPLEDRAAAGATSLIWSAASSAAQRIARPLGMAVGAAEAALGLAVVDASQPPGARADDVVVCRQAQATIADAIRPGRHDRMTVWRVGVLRAGRLILDAVRVDRDPCAAPVDG